MSEVAHDAARHAAALARFAALTRIADEPIAPACRGFCFTHGRRTASATVFLHGLTASPRQFAALAAYAFEAGENVIVPRLPRHGHADRMSPALRDLRVDELQTNVAAQLAIAAELAVGVRVIGSLGGLLATWVAQTHAVRQVIAIAPFLGVAGVPRRLTGRLARELRRRPNCFVWWDPIRRETQLPAHGYPRYATHAIAEALSLAGQLATRARDEPPATARIMLVTNASEAAVSNPAVAALGRQWRRHPHTTVAMRELTGLWRSHDVIEPERNRRLVGRSYPQIFALLDETANGRA